VERRLSAGGDNDAIDTEGLGLPLTQLKLEISIEEERGGDTTEYADF
jgi:hypothetical protein